MIGRVCAVSLTVALGLFFASAETFAKSGGFSAKAGGLSAKSQGLSARHARPFYRAAPRSVFLPPIVPPFSPANAASPTRQLRPIGSIAPSHRRVFGYGLPAAGIGVYYGPNAIPFEVPLVASSGPDVRTAALRRRCGTETHIVPSEEGGERSITIRRC